MSETHRFWSFYEDSSCSGAPTGVFVQRLNACEEQVQSNGAHCEARNDSSNSIVGYADDSCYDGRVAGLDALFGGEPYMAYDYFNDATCTDFENAAAYLASGDCETLYDGYSPFRSATISVSDGVLVWTRNTGNASTALNCPGSTGTDYYEFDVPIGDISNATCENFENIGGGFVFYNTTVETSSSGSSSSTSISSGASLSGGAIAGIACGAAVVVVFFVVLACCIRKRSKRAEGLDSHSLQDPLMRGSAWTGGATIDTEPSTLGTGLWHDPVIIATRVPRDQVKIEGLISRGGFGEVYRGMYSHEAVAIKMLFPEVRGDLTKVSAFLAEVKLMAGLSHPNIVRFVGVSWGSLTDLCVLTELMKGGDLRELLKEFESQGHPQGIDHDKIRIAFHIAQALTYLHSLSPIVIHRDLKSKNVLLTEDLDAKVTDFGASRERQEQTMTAGVGTMLWMAPEVMMAENYNEKADIYSFGVILSELDLQSLPYSHARVDSVTGKKLPDALILQKVASGALQVEFSPRCLASVVQLGKECVAPDPEARPIAPMVVFRLQTIMKESFGA
jgi:serine/threonine-protein kinase TNNI3K